MIMSKNDIKDMLSVARKVVDYTITGIEDGDVNRKFNLLDYYKITRISPTYLYRNCIGYLRYEYTSQQLKNFSMFISRCESDTRINKKVLLAMKHQLVIDDELVTITNDEKNMVMDYLKENKLPFVSTMYALVLKEYKYGNLDLNEEFVSLDDIQKNVKTRIKK